MFRKGRMTSLASRRVPGSLLVLGWSVSRRRVDKFLQAHGLPETVVLVDPKLDPGLAALVDIHVEAALVPAEGPVELISYSLPRLCSIRPATKELKALFPGLRERRRRNIATVTPQELIERLGKLEPPFHVLIDAPGAEMDVLIALEAIGMLEHMSWLGLRCGIDTFFEGARPSAALRETLIARHFCPVGQDDSDPDWPELHFEADFSSRLSEAQAALAERNAELDRLATDGAEKDQTIAEKDAALAEARAAAKSEAERRSAVEQQVAELARARDEAQAALAERNAELDRLATDGAEKDQTIAEKDAALAEARAAAKSEAEHRSAVEQQVAELARARDEAQAALAERNAELDRLATDGAEKDQTIAEKDAALAEARAAAKSEAERRSAVEQQVAELARARDEAQAALAERNAEARPACDRRR